MAREIANYNEPAEIDADFDDVTNAEQHNRSVEDEIDAEMGAGGGAAEYKMKVYRIPADGGPKPHLFDMAGEKRETLLTKLRNEYGDGVYLVRLYKSTNGNFQQYKVYRVAVERPTFQTPPASHGGSALEMAIQKQSELLARLVERISAPAPAPAIAPAPSAGMGDIVGMMRDLAGVMKDMMPSPPPAAPASNISPLELMTEAIRMAKELQSEGRERGVFDMVGDFINSPLMAKIADQLPGAVPQTHQRQIAPPPPTQSRAVPTHTAVEPLPQGATAAPIAPPSASVASPAPDAGISAEQQNMANEFLTQLSVIVGRARANADPTLYAEVVGDMVEPAILDQLLALPDPIGMLATYNPEVAKHRAWFGQLIEALTEPDDAAHNVNAFGTATPPVGMETHVPERSTSAAKPVDGAS